MKRWLTRLWRVVTRSDEPVDELAELDLAELEQAFKPHGNVHVLRRHLNPDERGE